MLKTPRSADINSEEIQEPLWPEKNKFPFTVVIPACNEEKNLAELIPQILAETPRCEILVCDNNSKTSDQTKQVVEEFSVTHPNVRYLDANPSKKSGKKEKFQFGAPNARNFGAARAQGEYIFFLDADTRFGKDFFKKSLHHMKYRSLNAAGFDFEPNTNADSGAGAKLADHLMLGGMNLLQNVVVNSKLSVALGAAMVVERKFQKDPDLQFKQQICEDVDWARTATKKGKFGIIDTPGLKASMRRMEGRRLNLARLYFNNFVHMILSDTPTDEMTALYSKDPEGKPYH